MKATQMISNIYIIFFALIVFVSCIEDETDFTPNQEEFQEETYLDPIIEISLGDITSSSVDVQAKIISLGANNGIDSWENNDISYGFLWFPIRYDENGNFIEQFDPPVEVKLGKIDRSGQISFSHLINELEANTEYTVCAFISDQFSMFPTGETTLVTDY